MDSFNNFAHNTLNLVIVLYIERIETNFQIGKHNLGVFTWNLKQIVSKSLFRASFMCLFIFVAFGVDFNIFCCWTHFCGLLSCIHIKVTDQSWQTGPNASVLHFEVVVVVSRHQIGKLLWVIYLSFWLFLVKMHKRVCFNLEYLKH